MARRRWLIFGIIIIIVVIVGGFIWWLVNRDSAPEQSGEMTETQTRILNLDTVIGSEDEAESAYQEQLQLKDRMANAPKDESIPYYNYLVVTASNAGLCEDADRLAKELESIDVESAFNSYFNVIRCYDEAGDKVAANEIRQYIQDNIIKLPESRRSQFDSGVSS